MQKDIDNKPTRSKSAKRAVLIVLVVILSVVLALLLTFVIGVNVMLSRLHRPEEQTYTMSQEELENILNQPEDVPDDFSGPVLSVEDVTIPQAEMVVEDNDSIVNIMLLGADNFSAHYRSRTDAMILCTINRTEKTVTLTSFMRDTYVYIPEFYNQRLNVAYPVGGFQTLYDTLEYNFGVSVDKSVAVNFSSFREVIDAVGGVDIELTGSEADHLNAQDSTWWLIKGMNTLTGEQALAYSRIRYLDNDYYRTNRQRNVLSALFRKAQTLSVTELFKMVSLLIPMVSTDMSNEEILDVAGVVAPLLKDLTLVTQRIPIDGAHTLAMVDGMSVLIPDLEENSKFLKETLGFS